MIRPARSFLTAATCALFLAISLGGCAHSPWVVAVVNQTDTDYLVKITGPGGSNIRLVHASGAGDLVHAPRSIADMRLELLDPNTCGTIGTVDVPTVASSWASIIIPGEGQPVQFGISPKDLVADPGLLPEDSRCA